MEPIYECRKHLRNPKKRKNNDRTPILLETREKGIILSAARPKIIGSTYFGMKRNYMRNYRSISMKYGQSHYKQMES